MPNAEYRVLEGQTHEVSPEVIAPVLVEFLTGRVARLEGVGQVREGA